MPLLLWLKVFIVTQTSDVTGPRNPSTPSPRVACRKLVSSFRCHSLKKIEEVDIDTEQLQQPDDSPSRDLNCICSSYLFDMGSTSQSMHTEEAECQAKNPSCYNHYAQLYRQFEWLLQTLIENKPFEQVQE
ncbi:hypothetical protein SOVF_110420 isoform B [Spinacia oleracea]|nr:hypothetical protein SOVF_110420 isoform B [Spinacia oleracea]